MAVLIHQFWRCFPQPLKMHPTHITIGWWPSTILFSQKLREQRQELVYTSIMYCLVKNDGFRIFVEQSIDDARCQKPSLETATLTPATPKPAGPGAPQFRVIAGTSGKSILVAGASIPSCLITMESPQDHNIQPVTTRLTRSIKKIAYES